MRRMLLTHADLKRKIESIEKKYDEQFQIVFEANNQLLDEDEKPKQKIGYVKETKAKYSKQAKKN